LGDEHTFKPLSGRSNMKNSQESPRSNRDIVKEINEPSTPESGARLAAGKIDDLPQQEVPGKLHNGRAYPPVQTVTTATEDVVAAKRAREKQIEGNRRLFFKRGGFEEAL
jgi:hypothetical protein